MARDLVFIASGGRTGTMFLGDLLSAAIPDSWSEHEADVWDGFSATSLRRVRDFGLWQVVVGRALGRTGVRALGTYFHAGERDFASCAARLREERQAYHRRVTQSLLIESFGSWWPFAGRIGEIFPGAKTVGVIRDPRHWIASKVQHRANHAERHWVYRFPPGPLTPARVGEGKWAARWDSMGRIGQLAWEWAAINQRLADGEAMDPAMRLFRFEDLFGPGTPAMPALLEFVTDFGDHRYPASAIPDTRERRNQSGNAGAEWEAWSEEEKALVDELCGPLMDRFGYPRLTAGTPARAAAA